MLNNSQTYSSYNVIQPNGINIIPDDNYTVVDSDYIITCKNWTTAYTMSLPDAISAKGRVLKIVNTTNHNCTFNISVINVDGTAGNIFKSAGIEIVSDGAFWQILQITKITL